MQTQTTFSLVKYRKPKIELQKVKLNLFVDNLYNLSGFENHIYLAASYCDCPIVPPCNKC